MSVNKYPEKVNLGGLWLMNPHAPRCHPSTCLEGAGLAPRHQPQYGTTQNDHFENLGSSWAGSANALPPAWKMHFPSHFQILTGNTLPEVDHAPRSYWEPFRGTHILRTQRYREQGPLGAFTIGDGISHPRHFQHFAGINPRMMPPTNFVAWYDSLIRRVNNPPGGLIGQRDPHLYPFRGFCWSLYFGGWINGRSGSADLMPNWWLIAGLEPNPERLNGDAVPRYRFFSAWIHCRPLAERDEALPSIFAEGGATYPRFNPLGKNVFRRVDRDGFFITDPDRITIEPFYG